MRRICMFRTHIGAQTELALMEYRHVKELFELIEANRAHLRVHRLAQ